MVSNYRQTGDVGGYHLVCGGDPPKMIGDGCFELLPDGDVKGSVHANSYMNGQRVVMGVPDAGSAPAAATTPRADKGY